MMGSRLPGIVGYYLLFVMWGGLMINDSSVLVMAFDQDVCVDVGKGEFSCTDDVLETREEVDGQTIDVGVTQRIDGSDSEKKAIREVLRRMDEYFFKEVLAMPEYENVRPHW
jgi:hypothetical protein